MPPRGQRQGRRQHGGRARRGGADLVVWSRGRFPKRGNSVWRILLRGLGGSRRDFGILHQMSAVTSSYACYALAAPPRRLPGPRGRGCQAGLSWAKRPSGAAKESQLTPFPPLSRLRIYDRGGRVQEDQEQCNRSEIAWKRVVVLAATRAAGAAATGPRAAQAGPVRDTRSKRVGQEPRIAED